MRNRTLIRFAANNGLGVSEAFRHQEYYEQTLEYALTELAVVLQQIRKEAVRWRTGN